MISSSLTPRSPTADFVVSPLTQLPLDADLAAQAIRKQCVVVRRKSRDRGEDRAAVEAPPPTIQQGHDLIRDDHFDLDGGLPSVVLSRRPSVLDAVSPRPVSISTRRGSSPRTAPCTSWPLVPGQRLLVLVSAFIEDLTETARHLAARSPALGSTHPYCSPSTKSGTCRPCLRSRR